MMTRYFFSPWPRLAALLAAVLLSAPVHGDNHNPLTNPIAAIAGLGLGDSNDDILPPDQAFIFDVDVQGEHALLARWRLAEGHYLYRDKFKLALQNADGIRLGAYIFPQGKVKSDEFFGATQVFYQQVAVEVPLLRSGPKAAKVDLQADYQGCSEITGICYPPITKTISLDLPGIRTAAAATLDTADSAAGPRGDGEIMVSEQDRLAQTLSSGNILLSVLTFFGLGLFLAFTPCVFPMAPILSSIIAGQGQNISAAKAFTLSLAYVLAMALTYTVAGVIAGVSGANIQAAFQNPWVISSFSALFVLLALSMFGFYELRLPNSLQTRLTAISNRQHSGQALGAAVMGFLSALIVGPCVAPPLIGALIYIGQTGDPALGGLALFALSLGMGAPLLAVGAGAGKLLPKAGKWMDLVQAVFGVLLLALAIWMLERILPGELTLLLWGSLLTVSAIYIGALDSLSAHASGWARLWKGAGLVMLLYGAVLIVGATAGGKDPLQPLRSIGIAAVAPDVEHRLPFEPIKTVADLDAKVAAASVAGRPVMLDFYADWCVSCKEMERFTFSDPQVQAALTGVSLLQADVTDNDAQDQALLKHLGLIGPPSILFYGANGRERRPYRLVGYLAAADFRDHLARAIR